MSIKKDNGDATDAKVQAAVHKYIDANAQYWSTQNGKSPLKDVRGKIVLARRYKNDNNYSDSKGGMHFVWGDQGGSDVVDTPYVRWAVTGLTVYGYRIVMNTVRRINGQQSRPVWIIRREQITVLMNIF